MTVLCDSRFMKDLAIPRHQVNFFFFYFFFFLSLTLIFKTPSSSLPPNKTITTTKAGQYADPGKSYLIPFWSACISFSKAHAFRTVMFDCCAPYTFDGEEFSYGIRLWTHGYVLFCFVFFYEFDCLTSFFYINR